MTYSTADAQAAQMQQQDDSTVAYIFNWTSRFGYQTIKLPSVTASRNNGVVSQTLRENGGETKDSIRIFEALNVPVTVINEYLPDYRPKKRESTHINIGTKWARMIVQGALQRDLRDKYLKSVGLEGWMFSSKDIDKIAEAIDDIRQLMSSLLALLRDDRVYFNAFNVYGLRVRRVFEAADLDEEMIDKYRNYFPSKEQLVPGSQFNVTTSIPKPLNAETAAIREIAQFAGSKEQRSAMEMLIDSGASSLRQAAEQARQDMVDEMMQLVAEQLDKIESVEGKSLTSAARAKLDEQATRIQSLLNMLDGLQDRGEFSDVARTVQSIAGELRTGHTVELSERLSSLRRELRGEIDVDQLDSSEGEGHRAVGRWMML